MTLSEYANDFLAYVKHEQGCATATCKCYGAQLRYFLRWMEQSGYPAPTVKDFTLPVLRRSLYFLSERGLRPRTIRGYIIALRSLGSANVR